MQLLLLTLFATSSSALNAADYPAPNAVPRGNPAWTNSFLQNNAGLADILTQCTNQNTWALTYDDGPSPYTPQVLDNLSSRRFKATFFVIGSNVLQNPDILLIAYQ